MIESRRLAAALALAAHEINAASDLEATLHTIAQVALTSLPEIDHVGVSLAHRDGRVETKAYTDDLVLELDRLQYSFNEGPCLHALTTAAVVRVENARHEQRWPKFIPEAVKLGLRAQLGLRLYADHHTLGGLNLYSVSHDTIDDDTVERAELFATHAALALGRARREEQLNTALTTRHVIGQAVGIVMERFSITEPRAFEYLTRVSSTSEKKLRDVAKALVDQSNQRAVDSPDPGEQPGEGPPG